MDIDDMSVDQLVQAALRLDSDDDHEYWEFIGRLEQRPAGALLPIALGLVKGDGRSRELAAIMLGGPNDGERTGRPLAGERLGALLELVDSEVDMRVVRAAASAIGNFDDERVVPALWALSDADDWSVRWTLTCAASNRDDVEAHRLLVKLSNDDDARVRDWATASLGRFGSYDSDLIRDALADRLDDVDSVTAEEAMCGLAERMDLRALEYTLRARAAEEEPEDQWEVLKASWSMAAATGDARFRTYLLDDHEEFSGESEYPPELRAACEACFGNWPPNPGIELGD